MDKLTFPIWTALSAGVLIFSIFFAVFFLWPKYVEFQVANSNIQAMNEEIEEKEKHFEELRKTREDLKNYENELVKINSGVPEEISIPEMFQYVQLISSQSGMVLKDVKHSAIAPFKSGSDLKEIQMTLSLEGPYSTLKNFLITMEKSARLFEVASISFISEGEKDLFNFDIIVKAKGY